MLLDAQSTFCDRQQIDSGESYSSNVVYLGERDNFAATHVPFLVQVTDDFIGAKSINIEIETSSVSDFSENTYTCGWCGFYGDIKAGQIANINFLPPHTSRYARLKFNVSIGSHTEGEGDDEHTVGNEYTAGTITAGVVAACDAGWQNM